MDKILNKPSVKFRVEQNTNSMAEFYLVKEERIDGFEFFSIGSTKRFLRYLRDELGMNEEFVSTFDEDEEEDDLFSIAAENGGTYGHSGVMDAFDKMEKKLKRLAPGIRDRTLKFVCMECQILFRDTKRCGADKCICLHPCDCDNFVEINFL